MALLALLGAFAVPRASAQLSFPVSEDFSDGTDDIGTIGSYWSISAGELRSGDTGNNNTALWTIDPISVPGAGTVALNASLDLTVTSGGGGANTNVQLQKSENGGVWSIVYTYSSTSGTDVFPGYSASIPAGTVQFRWLASTKKRSANLDDISITFVPDVVVNGCTDPMACNYNSSATSDDGTCTYANGCDFCSG
ncbi:MAG: hypothetical protein ACPGYZ_06385, partial [Flavobacteriales bacterium]